MCSEPPRAVSTLAYHYNLDRTWNSSKIQGTDGFWRWIWGRKRIGLALSDPLGISAQGLDTLQRTTIREDIAALEASPGSMR